jgi:hypothetical protein
MVDAEIEAAFDKFAREEVRKDEVRWAQDWILSLPTPPCPLPSAWTDVAWCAHWREQRSRVLRVLVAVEGER